MLEQYSKMDLFVYNPIGVDIDIGKLTWGEGQAAWINFGLIEL